MRIDARSELTRPQPLPGVVRLRNWRPEFGIGRRTSRPLEFLLLVGWSVG